MRSEVRNFYEIMFLNWCINLFVIVGSLLKVWEVLEVFIKIGYNFRVLK